MVQWIDISGVATAKKLITHERKPAGGVYYRNLRMPEDVMEKQPD
jgi:hypothetical protein